MVSRTIPRAATSGHYRLFTGPAFFVQIDRGREQEAIDRAQVFEQAENVMEFQDGKDLKFMNRQGLMDILVTYLHSRDMAVYTPIRVDGEARQVELFRTNINVREVIEDLMSDWQEGSGQKEARKFYKRFLKTFHRRSDPVTVEQMKPFVYNKTAWVHVPSAATPPTPQEPATPL